MPDEDDEQDVITSSEQIRKPGLRKYVQELEAKAKDADGADVARRKLAIYESGITDPAAVKLLTKVHEGELNPEALQATLKEYGVSSGSSGEQDPAAAADKARRDAERREAMEGQEHLGEVKFGDWRPEGASAQDRLVADLREAQSKITATDYRGALEQGKAVMRDVLHSHGMVLADEID